jgi:hypothetical protein
MTRKQRFSKTSKPARRETCRHLFIADRIAEKLKRRSDKRHKTGDHRVCAAHDIAPPLERLFEIRFKDLEKNNAFREILRHKGLSLPNDDAGLPAIRNKKRTPFKSRPLRV